MNCTRIIKEMVEYAINSMTLEEQKYFRSAMFNAIEELDELILSKKSDSKTQNFIKVFTFSKYYGKINT